MAQPASACSAAAVYPAAPSKVIDLTPHLQRRRRNRRQAVLHTVLALWTQYLSLGCLLLYALLRVVLTGSIPLGQYSGPLAVLDSYYGQYTTMPDDAKLRLDVIQSEFAPAMESDYDYPPIFFDIDTTDRDEFSRMQMLGFDRDF